MRKKRKQAELAPTPLEPKRVTPVDIQQKEFRLAMRGYNERDVDQFLDEVTEEVARLYADNKRLREEVEFSRTTRLETTDAAEAEGILRQAREEAARIIADATARASTIGAPQPDSVGQASASGAPPNEIMGIFLARERAFLQNMANLIQAHAEGVKQDVRGVREQVGPQPAGADVPPAEVPQGDIQEPVAAHTETADAAAGSAGPTAASAAAAVGAWEATRDEPQPAIERAPHDIVDLTREEGVDAEGTGEGPTPEEEPESSVALSTVHGRASASAETTDASGPVREGAPGGSPSPIVEDDRDDRGDRSIREFFWGED
jgi:cell division initiation protein